MANSLDKKGPKVEDLITSMEKLGIKYNIIVISDKLTDMLKEFKQMDKGGMITVFEMEHGLEFDKITQSVVTQIEKYVEKDDKPSDL